MFGPMATGLKPAEGSLLSGVGWGVGSGVGVASGSGVGVGRYASENVSARSTICVSGMFLASTKKPSVGAGASGSWSTGASRSLIAMAQISPTAATTVRPIRKENTPMVRLRVRTDLLGMTAPRC